MTDAVVIPSAEILAPFSAAPSAEFQVERPPSLLLEIAPELFEECAYRVTDHWLMPEDSKPLPTPKELAAFLTGRLVRYIIMGGATALREDDIASINAVIGALYVEGGAHEWISSLISLRDRVLTLLKERKEIYDRIDEQTVRDEWERLKVARKGQVGGLGG